MPKPPSALDAPLLAGSGGGGGGSRPLSDGELFGIESKRKYDRSRVAECPSDEIEWPQYEILQARGPWQALRRFWRYLWFLWFDPLMKLGDVDFLEMSDVWKLAPRDSCSVVYRELEPLWQAEIRRAAAAGVPPSFARACARYCRYYWAVAFALRFTAEMMNFVRPLAMQQVLLTLQLPDNPSAEQLEELWLAPERSWLLAVLMFGSAMMWTFGNVHYNQWVMTHALRLRSAVICCLYEKTMRLSPGAKAAYTNGKISNLMSNDADKMPPFMNQSPWLVMIPINIGTALFLIIRLLGWAGVAGAATMVRTTTTTRDRAALTRLCLCRHHPSALSTPVT